MRICISSAGGAALCDVEIGEEATVRELKAAIAAKKPKLPAVQQELRYVANFEPVVLANDRKLSEYGLGDNSELILKNLGPQIAPRALYLAEYAGPLAIFPAVALLARGEKGLVEEQRVAAFLWCLHFAKRILETLFVHNFSGKTYPLRCLFKNCAYYYGFAGLVAWRVCLPAAQPPPAWRLYVGFPVFVAALICNFICHLQLHYLRRPGTSVVGLPRHFLFDYVSCPHYLCEIVMWLGFNILTGFTLPGVLFNLVGAAQMWQWAKKKHLAYRRTFKEYPRRRKILVPFLL